MAHNNGNAIRTMKKTISVPQIIDCIDSSYKARVDYRDAIAAGATKLGAVRHGRRYFYRADETDEVYRLTPMEVAKLGAGEIDGRGADYSLWCSQTGQRVMRLSKRITI